MEWFTLTLLVTPALAAWRPAPGVPANRQTGTGSGSGCPYEAHTQTCNETQIDCNSGMSPEGCWHGNYCIQQIQEWDGCPGVCSTYCNWETEDYCSYEPDSDGCWMGNWCQNKSMGGCPDTGSSTDGFSSGSGSCPEYFTQVCNETQIYCDSGSSPEGCWYGNYCIDQTNAYDNCPGICSQNCNWEVEDWCDMGADSDGCWMGNWCQDRSLGGCPTHTGSGMTSIPGSSCYPPYTQECNATEIHCDSGIDGEGCWMGNYCQPAMIGNCPGIRSQYCSYEEVWCDT